MNKHIYAAVLVGMIGVSKAIAQVPTTMPSLANTSVSIPWRELQELIDKAKGTEDKPPVDFVVSNAKGDIAVGEKTAQVLLDVEIDVLAKGWVMVPLGQDVGLLGVTSEGKSVPTVSRNGVIFALVNGKEAGKLTLQVKLERAIEMEGGVTRLRVPTIPGAVINAVAKIPQGNLEVTTNGAAGVKIDSKEKETTVAGSFAASGSGAITWKKQSADVGRVARVSSDSQTTARVEKGSLRVKSRVTIHVERAAVQKVTLRVDGSMDVVSVLGPGVVQWSEAKDKDGKTVSVEFAEKFEGDRAIEIVSERDLAEGGGAVKFVLPAVEGSKQSRGIVAVSRGQGIEVRPGESSAERISVSELPDTLRGVDGTTQMAYRYSGNAATVGLDVAPEVAKAARILATTQTRVAIDRGVVRSLATIRYDIQHAGVDSLRVALPEGVEFVAANGQGVHGTQVVTEGNKRTLVVGLKDLAKGAYQLVVAYERRFGEKDASVPINLVTPMDASVDQGFVGIEVGGSFEIKPTVEGAERVDVKELPSTLWSAATSPLLFGFRYDKPVGKFEVALTRHEDLDVLIAMSDICETTTTVTSDGKVITKMMFVMRNNLKPFLTLNLPKGAQVWSSFVDDRPVTPSKNANGEVLIPLKRSEAVEEDDDNNYRQQRENRRNAGKAQQALQQAAKQIKAPELEASDLKPYDVEIVFVSPAVKLDQKGELQLALPKVDVPIGQLAWAVCLPKELKVTDWTGNVKAVDSFTLPFRHFAEESMQAMQKAEMAKAMMDKLSQAQQKALESATAKGVLPVRVEIPISGTIYRFEKFLTVEESPEVGVSFNQKVR